MPETLAPDVSNYLAKDRFIHEKKGPIPEKIELPTIADIPKPLIEIANNVAEISSTWNPVEIYSVDSATSDIEKRKFLNAFAEGKEYNPKFNYPYADSLNLNESRKKLHDQMSVLRNFGETKKGELIKRGGRQTLDRPARLFRGALYFKIKDDLATCDLVDGIKSRNDKKIAAAMKQKYPGTDQALQEAAINIYNNMLSGNEEHPQVKREGGYPLTEDEQKFLKERELTTDEFRDLIQWGLEEYGIDRTPQNPNGFAVKLDKETSAMDVRDKSKNGPTVFIEEGRKLKADKALELLTHEIERHARQSKNGEKLFMIGGGKLKVDNEMLYEGYGKAGDEEFRMTFFGDTTGEPIPYYTFAISSAEKGSSFFNVFSQQVDLRLHARLKIPLEKSLPGQIDPKLLEDVKDSAWSTTLRVMRGHTDTSNKAGFAMAKDLSYLRGWLIDKQLRNNNLGFLNESGVIASGALQLLAELKLDGNIIPIKNKHIAKKAWETKFKPEMKAS